MTTTTLGAGTNSRVYPILLIGILAVSTAAIFVRFAQEAGLPSLLIAAGRLTLSALVLTPFALSRYLPQIRGLKRDELLLAASSGLLLAVHFASWIASLEYTSVLISVVFVSTNPIWVALLEFFFLKTRLNRVVIAGLLLALVGGILIGSSGGGDGAGSQPVLGAVLALVGGVAVAIYLIIGRKLRARLPLLPYIWLVYGWAAIFLVLMVMLTRTPVIGFPADSYLWIVLLALVPQLIGHTTFNYALQYLSATYVSIAIQMEPIGSALAAFLLFREVPTAIQLGGSLLILFGVGAATLGQTTVQSGKSKVQSKNDGTSLEL